MLGKIRVGSDGGLAWSAEKPMETLATTMHPGFALVEVRLGLSWVRWELSFQNRWARRAAVEVGI